MAEETGAVPPAMGLPFVFEVDVLTTVPVAFAAGFGRPVRLFEVVTRVEGVELGEAVRGAGAPSTRPRVRSVLFVGWPGQ